MKGSILSINPMSFDCGPGIRVAIKMDEKNNIELTPKETVDRIRKFRPYFGPNGGGVTFSGNLSNQIEYLKETCLLAHKAGITTCLQTDGRIIVDNELLKNVDLVILEINSLPLYNYSNLSMEELMNVNKLISKLEENKINIWIKQVIKKDINDNEEYVYSLKKYLGMYNNIIDIELIGDGINIDILNSLQKILEGV